MWSGGVREKECLFDLSTPPALGKKKARAAQRKHHAGREYGQESQNCKFKLHPLRCPLQSLSVPMWKAGIIKSGST
jgi:hypothetical protein